MPATASHDTQGSSAVRVVVAISKNAGTNHMQQAVCIDYYYIFEGGVHPKFNYE